MIRVFYHSKRCVESAVVEDGASVVCVFFVANHPHVCLIDKFDGGAVLHGPISFRVIEFMGGLSPRLNVCGVFALHDTYKMRSAFRRKRYPRNLRTLWEKSSKKTVAAHSSPLHGPYPPTLEVSPRDGPCER